MLIKSEMCFWSEGKVKFLNLFIINQTPDEVSHL